MIRQSPAYNITDPPKPNRGSTLLDRSIRSTNSNVFIGIFCILEDRQITTHKKGGCESLQLHTLAYICDSSNQVVGMNLTFKNFKHSYNERPFTLMIKRQPTCCPIAFLLDYLPLRDTRQGALFLT